MRLVYDGDGGRVKQTTAAGTIRYLGEAYEVAPAGTTTKYVFAGSQRLVAKDSTGALRFYHGDHLGSSNVVTDGAGALVELAEYTPYGTVSRREGSANVAHKFTGQRFDTSTGLAFYHARYYDPQLGRFVSPDPIVQDPTDPQTLNRYAYVRNNPVNLVDPSGYFFQFLVALVIAVVKVVIDAAIAIGTLYVENAAFQAVVNAAVVAAASSAFSSPSASAAVQESTSPRGPPGSRPLLGAGTGQPISDPIAFAQQHGGRLPIFINGVDTTEEAARDQALGYALTVFYNPSAGKIPDFAEAASQLGGPTDIDLELARLLNQLAEAGMPVDIVAFSQGNEIIWNAARAGARFAPGSTITPYGSPLSLQTLREALPETVELVPNRNNSTDPINLIQGADAIRQGDIFGGIIRMYGGRLGAYRDLLTFGRFTTHRMPRRPVPNGSP
jgi:RHS repeat-associated protein